MNNTIKHLPNGDFEVLPEGPTLSDSAQTDFNPNLSPKDKKVLDQIKAQAAEKTDEDQLPFRWVRPTIRS